MPLQATSGAASYDGFGGGVAVKPNYIEDVFSPYLYTGNGSTQTITNSIDLAGKGGLVWLKNRNSTQLHWLFDSIRGKDSPLSSTNTDLVATNVANYFGGSNLCVFNSTGFTTNGAQAQLGTNGNTYTSWTFRKQPKFFDVVTYTGNGVAGTQIPHSLGSTPGCIIVKRYAGAGGAIDWAVWHNQLGGSEYLRLNTNNAGTTNSAYPLFGAVTSSYFTVGNASATGNNGTTNSAGDSFVAYVFAHNAGGFGPTGTDNVISCGYYTGGGASDVSVNLGYEPQFVLIKSITTLNNWNVFDSMRGMPVTGSDARLLVNSSLDEASLDFGTNVVAPTATGFIARANAGNEVNGSGVGYIYMAIRRGPMKVPTDGTSVFSAITSSAGTGTKLTTGFPVDLQIENIRGGNPTNSSVMDRMRGVSTTTTETSAQYLVTSTTDPENTSNTNRSRGWDSTGFQMPSGFASAGAVFWNFRRAPNFLDEVCYTGTGVAMTVNHNLGVTPELMIVKARNGVLNWKTYDATTGATNNMNLNLDTASAASSTNWNNTAPTASVFTVGTSAAVNGSGTTYVAYLFATCAGVSKVGSYTGNGSTQTINCGFTGGARFVLIKRTDSTGDWYVWDTARGIVSGNDPYLLLNSTATEVTTTDYIDPYSAGFEISSTAPAAINASGGTYIYLAIA